MKAARLGGGRVKGWAGDDPTEVYLAATGRLSASGAVVMLGVRC